MVGREGIRLFAEEYPYDYPEPETAVRLISQGYRVTEIPIQMKERRGGVSSISSVKSIYYMIKVTIAIIIEGSRKVH